MGLHGDRLKALREKRGFTQEEFSAQAEVSLRQLLRYEKNQSEPGVDAVIRMANILQVSVDYLLGLSNDDTIHVTEEGLSDSERRFVTALRRKDKGETLDLLTSITKDWN